ncbi:MAG: phosphoglycerate kinase [Candidatus Bipolaricaulota bacterium]|nr:phosphoglycerate kinase [Candidatus Bipolaricaulota bacterium]MDW8031152.1 phosphoglycerate kinase [Candidatus Bipolaricaulota bacterium]
MLRTLRDLEVAGRRVLVRVDYNVPLQGERILDDARLRESLPTLEYLLTHQAKIILLSHLGRPAGKVVPELRLDPIARRLAELLGRPVTKLNDCIGPEVSRVLSQMRPGDIVLLENVRFYPQEEANDEGFARELARLADCYVNDAFGAAHRAHASTYGVAKFLPAAAGLLLEREVTMLSRATENPARPFIAIVGGAKLSDKIGVLKDLLGKVEAFLIGGAVAFTVIKARGGRVGSSLVDEKMLDEARQFLQRVPETELILPVDAHVGRGGERALVPADAIPDGWQAWDIGPQTIRLFQEQVRRAKTIVWAGPLGKFEEPPYDAGTRAVAQAIAASEAFAIIGGGDTAAALHQAGLAHAKNIYCSTGGGAALEFIGGRRLLPIEILKKS